MSNPGVITLTQKRIDRNKSFRVEDNLGESIHLHYNDIRIDLTIRELIKLAEICDETIYELINVEGFNLDDFDDDFLMKYSRELADLQSIDKETVKVSDLYYQKHAHGSLWKNKHISKYDGNGGSSFTPVLFNDGKVLAFGAETAAKVYKTDRNATIEVYRLRFEKNKYSISNHPVLSYLFKWNKARIIRTGENIVRKILGKK